MAESFPHLLADAMRRLDAEARFAADDVRGLRAALDRWVGESPDRPSDWLGPWEAVSEPGRAAARSLLERDIAGAMDAHPSGRWWPEAAGRLYRRSERLKAEGSEASQRSAVRAERWAQRLWHRPDRTRRAVVRWFRRWRWARAARPTLADLVARLGREPEWLAVDFADGIAVDPRCRGFYHDAARHVVWGYFLGIDLLPTERGLVCIESNLGAGIVDNWIDHVSRDEPIPLGLIRFLEAHGLNRVAWVLSGRAPIHHRLYRSLLDRLRERGHELEVFESPRGDPGRPMPDGLPPPTPSVLPPLRPPPGTLVVRRNGFLVASDRLVTDKLALTHALEAALLPEDRQHVSILPLESNPDSLGSLDPGGFPNLVYKHIDLDSGRGVHFLRARDSAHALEMARTLDARTGEGRGRFQPWLRRVEGASGRHEEYRAHLLVTPLGVEYLGSIARIGTAPAPAPVPWGIVEDRTPFIFLATLGHTSGTVDPADEPAVRRAALAVGRALARTLERTFVSRG